MDQNKKISREYFQQEDVVALSRQLLGKSLFTRIGPDNVVTGGKIIETEAYRGVTDKACHAYNGRRTQRTEVMYAPGGVAYVYFCYGMHHLFNIVTNQADIPHAILVRAIKPEVGIETMVQRRNKEKLVPTLTSGPGSLCQALGITRDHTALPLDGDLIWLEDHGDEVEEERIASTPRIGIAYAEEDALKPWRFCLKP